MDIGNYLTQSDIFTLICQKLDYESRGALATALIEVPHLTARTTHALQDYKKEHRKRKADEMLNPEQKETHVPNCIVTRKVYKRVHPYLAPGVSIYSAASPIYLVMLQATVLSSELVVDEMTLPYRVGFAIVVHAFTCTSNKLDPKAYLHMRCGPRATEVATKAYGYVVNRFVRKAYDYLENFTDERTPHYKLIKRDIVKKRDGGVLPVEGTLALEFEMEFSSGAVDASVGKDTFIQFDLALRLIDYIYPDRETQIDNFPHMVGIVAESLLCPVDMCIAKVWIAPWFPRGCPTFGTSRNVCDTDVAMNADGFTGAVRCSIVSLARPRLGQNKFVVAQQVHIRQSMLPQIIE